MQYTQDYDEKYPLSTTYEEQTDSTMPGKAFSVSTPACTSGNCVSWMDLLHPYVKSIQLYVCPSVRNGAYPSYGYSGAFGNPRNKYKWDFSIYVSGGVYPPTALAQVQRPAEVYAVVEYNYSAAIWASPYEQGRAARATNNDRLRVVPHMDGGNVAYADGHVKWINAEKFKSLGSDNQCRLEAIDTSSAFCSRDWNPFIP